MQVCLEFVDQFDTYQPDRTFGTTAHHDSNGGIMCAWSKIAGRRGIFTWPPLHICARTRRTRRTLGRSARRARGRAKNSPRHACGGRRATAGHRNCNLGDCDRQTVCVLKNVRVCTCCTERIMLWGDAVQIKRSEQRRPPGSAGQSSDKLLAALGPCALS